MRLIIEARVELAESNLQLEPRRLAVLDRMDDDLEQLGLDVGGGTRAAGRGAVRTRVQPSGSSGWPRKITAVDAAPRCTTKIEKSSAALACIVDHDDLSIQR
jgi:hypothetical protein